MKKSDLFAVLLFLTWQLNAGAANTAPLPTAPAITMAQATSATSQVSPNDVDVGDTATYSISANPAHGSASVSSTGLVTYTPTVTYYGSDSLQVRVTDGAGAQGTVSIPIVVRRTLIATALPEHVPFNSALVAACQTTITLKYPADVQAYFLDEGAGYHNQIGWYNVADGNFHTIWADASSVLDLLGNTDGTLHTGDRVDLGIFSGGETIGFFLHNTTPPRATFTSKGATNSDALNHVLILAIPGTDFLLVSFEDKAGLSDYDYNDVMMLLRVGSLNVQNWIDTSTQPLQYSTPTKYQSLLANLDNADTDGDGVPDSQDQFPNDATRAFISFVPTPDYTVVAYEDEFPSIGDYDFNDAVVAYHVAYVTNANNQLVEIRGDAKLLAHGAALSHDWHLRFIGSSFSATATVTQKPGAQSSNTLATRSVSSTTSTNSALSEIDLPVILNTGASLSWHLGNTVPGWSHGTGDTATFSIVFASPIDPSTLQGAPFDPYLIVRDNGLDIHLPYKPLRKNSTNPTGARTFINEAGMPWAMVIPSTFQWPVEKTDIRTSFPRFTSWAASAGAHDTNWYLTPSLSNVIQTPQNNDQFIWGGNQTPAMSRRSVEHRTPASGFDFSTLATHTLKFSSNEPVVVSLLPLGADPSDPANASFATFRMMGSATRDVKVPAIWDSCIALVTPMQGTAWMLRVDWRDTSFDVSPGASSRLRVAVLACSVKLAPNANTASVLFTGCIDPEVLSVSSATTGTLYIGGVPLIVGGGTTALKTNKAGKNTPWNSFTVKATGLDVTPWANNGALDSLRNGQSVTLPVTFVTGGTALFGDAAIKSK